MTVCFTGCSFTAGVGLDSGEPSYVSLISNDIQQHCVNLATPGASNYKIFMSTADAIVSNQFSCVIAQWSALNRLWLYPGPDSEFFVNDSKQADFRYRELCLNAREKTKFREIVFMLNGDYSNIIELVRYCKILHCLAEKCKTTVIFVNGLVPWQDDLTKPLTQDLSTLLSTYSKTILDFDHRDDAEITEFFSKLQTHFGRLDQSLWVNLFEPWNKNLLDRGTDNLHPGPRSHQWMADRVQNYIRNNTLL